MRHLGKNVVIALALVAAGFFVAWLRYRPYLGATGAYTDGARDYAVAQDPVRFAVWDAPEAWGGAELTGAIGAPVEDRVARSADGRWAVFAVGEEGLDMDLWIAELVDGVPVDPRPLAGVRSPADERAPSFGHGALYFASDRPGGAGGLDLYRASFEGGRAGEAERLPRALQSPADDTDPAAVPGSPRVAFSSNRAQPDRSRDHDLYLAWLEGDSSSEAPEPIAAINGPGQEREPAFTADGRGLFFASDREGGEGGFDLYRSGRDGIHYTAPRALRGLNGPESERAPAPDPAGFELLLHTGDGDSRQVLRARSIELFQRPGRAVGWRDLLFLVLLLAVALFAWLAKRWEQLDVVYKCFLVSLVMHLLLALWLNQVHPEPTVVASAGSSGERIQLRLVGRDPSGIRARNAEAGGAVELVRSLDEALAGADPTFARTPGEAPAAGTEAMSLSAAAQPQAARLARAEPLPPSALAPREPSTADAPAPSAAVAAAPAVAQPEAPAGLRSAAAPEVAVGEAQNDAPERTSTSPSGATLERAESAESTLAEAAPDRARAERAAPQAAPLLPAAGALAAADAPQLDSAARSGEIANPETVAPTRQGGAPDLTVAGAERLDPLAPTGGESAAPSLTNTASRRGLEASEPTPGEAALARAEGARSEAPAAEAALLEARAVAQPTDESVRSLEAQAAERAGAAPELALPGAPAMAAAERGEREAAPTAAEQAERSEIADSAPDAARAERAEAGLAAAAAPEASPTAEDRAPAQGPATTVATLAASGATMDTNGARDIGVGEAQRADITAQRAAAEVERSAQAERRALAEAGPESARAERTAQPSAAALAASLVRDRAELPEASDQAAPSAELAQIDAPAGTRNAEAAPLALLAPAEFGAEARGLGAAASSAPAALDSAERPRADVADGSAGAADLERVPDAVMLAGVAPEAASQPARSAVGAVEAELPEALPAQDFAQRSGGEPMLALGGPAQQEALVREGNRDAGPAEVAALDAPRAEGRAPAPASAAAERVTTPNSALANAPSAAPLQESAPAGFASAEGPALAQAPVAEGPGRSGEAPALELSAAPDTLAPTAPLASKALERASVAVTAGEPGELQPSAAAGLSRPRRSAGPAAPAFAGAPMAQLSGPKSQPGTDLVALALPAASAQPGASGPAPAALPTPELSAAAGLDRPRASGAAELRRPDRSARAATPEGPRPGFTPLLLPEVPAPSSALALAPAETGDNWERTPYQSRGGAQKIEALATYGGSEATEAAVQAGLAYLARKQSGNGFWGSAGDEHNKYRHVVIGKSGLSLLAFLGAGHTQVSNTEYSGVVGKAIAFLTAVQDPASGHFGNSGAYSHAIATYALGECLALTGDERLRAPLEQAVQHILKHQQRSDDPRLHGGWGYYFPDGRMRTQDGDQIDSWPRASVTAWQVMALESAQLGGLEIPAQAFDDASSFLRGCWDARRGGYRYSHDPERLSGPYQILPGSTPASLFALSLLGEDIGGSDYRPARNFVTSRMPTGYRYRDTNRFVNRAEGNLYFWYYGTLALFRLGGRPWEAWNEAMKATLLPAQEEDGSWRPISIYATDYAQDSDDDRSYTTAMCVLSLEVYYRYFTPLLQVK